MIAFWACAVCGHLGFRGWSSLYTHSRITLRKNLCAMLFLLNEKPTFNVMSFFWPINYLFTALTDLQVINYKDILAVLKALNKTMRENNDACFWFIVSSIIVKYLVFGENLSFKLNCSGSWCDHKCRNIHNCRNVHNCCNTNHSCCKKTQLSLLQPQLSQSWSISIVVTPITNVTIFLKKDCVFNIEVVQNYDIS